MFFKMITLENGYELSDQINYRYFETTMDYLQRIIKSQNFRQARQYKINIIPFMDIVKTPNIPGRAGHYWIQKERIIDKIRQAKKDISKMYIDYDLKSKEEKEIVWENVAERKQDCVNEIDRMSESEGTMYLVLKEIDNEEYKDVARFVFEVLFGKPNESFFKMIEASKEDLYQLVEDKEGDVKLYDFTYKKVKNA